MTNTPFPALILVHHKDHKDKNNKLPRRKQRGIAALYIFASQQTAGNYTHSD